ncbi:abnormal cell migration protein 10 isoform X1 [Episyrphus balteatus]|uniref:abnormal cell migration protein 10 isoform X1 n=2 Tax=Episyrphus balteatus TaxID=286459 RepID=UPI0024865F5B|nr:abnormal cell migration protein 10 isoform X1 [Episyrphus balteatus]
MDCSFTDYDSIANYLNESVLDLPEPLSVLSSLKNKEGETNLTTSTTTSTAATTSPAGVVKLRRKGDKIVDRSSAYRFSMANLEESHESELDAILGELSLLEQAGSICGSNDSRLGRTHSRSNSTISGATNSSISYSSESNTSSDGMSGRETRTESPDNDSAFSDTVSLLSSESSASSNISSALNHHKQILLAENDQEVQLRDKSKAAKIQLALHKLEHASIRRLFVKAFTADGASKSLLVDERMTCGHVTRLLADKNHVKMQTHWALVENLSDLQMERLFEDHELLVDNLMTWNSDSKNKVMFLQRPDKIALFNMPEKFLPGTQMAPGSEHDEQTRTMLLEEFFESSGQHIQLDGLLYMKNDSKKGWKRYHFVLRTSGIYYFPKEKTKSPRDLMCLTLLTGYNVYRGLGWKKKFKSPTEYAFGLKSSIDSSPGKTCRSLKMLCAEDSETMEKWVTAIRIAKYGKQLWENHKTLLDEINRTDLNNFSSSNRSDSIISIASTVPSQSGSNISVPSSISSGRLSRASSSSSSGCLSDDNNGFDSEFTTGTIKRKPSMKPNLPLTTMTRQLKEVGEITICESICSTSPENSGTLTRHHVRRRSEESSGSGTLKRRQHNSKRCSMESMNSSNNSTPTPTPSVPSTPISVNDMNFVPNMNTTDQMSDKIPDSTLTLPPPPPLDAVDARMTSSTLSLDSLPPPPPPNELMTDFYGSQVSLVNLPPPPPPQELKPDYMSNKNKQQQLQAENTYSILKGNDINNMYQSPVSVGTGSCVKSVKAAIKAPPYKAPPAYTGGQPPTTKQNTNTMPKTVSFADSPVLLRRKVCFVEPPQVVQFPPVRPSLVPREVGVPLPPPRAEATRLSMNAAVSSPKRLVDSTANPPRDFLKDLQRVMRKKWQVAQKCKLEPSTTPHEVLGFRDFPEEFGGGNSHYYRETANVSNWVQEHYGSGADYALYENVNNDSHNIPEQFPISSPSILTPIKKRPPPPPPKRSESTHLTHRI